MSCSKPRTLVLFLCLAGIFLSQPAFAQAGGLVGLAHSTEKVLYDILQIMMGILGLGSIGMAAYRLMSGKQDSAKNFIVAFIALAVGYVLLEVFDIHATDSVGGASFGGAVASVLSSALCMVSMISLVGIVLKVMNAEEQSLGRLYTWLIASVVGIVLLNHFGAQATF